MGHRAVEDLAAAGFIESRASAPVSYRAKVHEWSDVLDFDSDEPPAWRPWASVYAFVAGVLEWVPLVKAKTPTVVASEARDLWKAHRSALEACGVRDAPAARFPGQEFLTPFVTALGQVAEYVDACA